MSTSDGRRAPAEAVTVRILGLAGSLRAGSTTRMAVRCALRGAEAVGAQVRLLDLANYELPFLGHENEASGEKAVLRFLGDLRDADGIIFGSPEIHGSLSGVLKNALDLTGREVFEGKMIGLIGVAGGRMGAGETLSHLRTIARSLHAWVVPTQVSVADAGKAFNSQGEPRDTELADRLESVGRQVAHFGRLHKCGEHVQFVKDWEGAALSDSGSSRLGSPEEERP
jgi:NAD(P)H-dependent FMN reductase